MKLTKPFKQSSSKDKYVLKINLLQLGELKHCRLLFEDDWDHGRLHIRSIKEKLIKGIVESSGIRFDIDDLDLALWIGRIYPSFLAHTVACGMERGGLQFETVERSDVKDVLSKSDLRKILSINPRLFAMLPYYCRDDPELARIAIRRSPHALKFVSPRLQDNKVLVMEAVSFLPRSLRYASKRLRNDNEVAEICALSSVRTKHNGMQFVSYKIRDNHANYRRARIANEFPGELRKDQLADRAILEPIIEEFEIGFVDFIELSKEIDELQSVESLKWVLSLYARPFVGIADTAIGVYRFGPPPPGERLKNKLGPDGIDLAFVMLNSFDEEVRRVFRWLFKEYPPNELFALAKMKHDVERYINPLIARSYRRLWPECPRETDALASVNPGEDVPF